MQNLTQPTLLLKPFAENGQRNAIPTNPTGTNRASLEEGFPPVTGQNPKDGGIPPTRLDFNGLGHLTTTYDYFYQAGGCFTFNQAVSNAIGGYPLNARLWYLNENGETAVLRSTKANNTDNFLTNPSVIGDSWVYDVATTTYVKDEINEIRTNCITEIPQDIKLELNNGTLTVKAGSKVYVPNGHGVFNVVNITSDKNFTHSSNGQFLIITDSLGNMSRSVYPAESGSTEPASKTTGTLWYDTTNNYCKRWNGSVWENRSLPIAIVSVSGGQITSIDQVFNGFGYIGSTVFALPGVKGLIPNGRNADGSLKNNEAVLTSVQKTTVNPGNGDWSIRIGNNYIAVGLFPYDENTNYNYNQTVNPSNIRYQFNAGTVKFSSGRITALTPKTTFHAVDYNDAVLNYGDQDIGGNKNFTGTLKAPTQTSATDNSTNVATTAWTNNFLNNKKSEIAGWGMPNYSAGISISSGSDVDIVANGYVSYVLNASGGGGASLTISIGGTNVYSMHVDYNNIASGGIPVAKGSTFKATVSNGVATLTFYPCIGG